VNSPIDKVWEFYTDVKHLEIVTPKEMRLKIINTTSEKLIQGSEIWLEAKLIFKIRWNSVIRSLKPYQYLDEMVKFPEESIQKSRRWLLVEKIAICNRDYDDSWLHSGHNYCNSCDKTDSFREVG
jgi:ligand-binding SRPBCC domain-containing protein